MEKQNVINRLSTGLKHERLAYKIYGIVTIVIAAIVIIASIFAMVAGYSATPDIVVVNDVLEYHIVDFTDTFVIGEDALIFGLSTTYLAIGVVLAVYGIVNLAMASKVGKYRFSEVLTVKHAGSVGSIVVAAIFNEIALIFAIINFVIAKKNRAVLEG